MDKKLLSSLQKTCAGSEHCSSQVRMKILRKTNGDTAAADEILEALIKDGYVDDNRYAAAFVRDKSALQAWGPVKIKFALKSKGLSDGVIDKAMAEIDKDKSDEKMLRLLSSRAAALEGDPQIRLKLLKYILSRGFDYSAAEEMMKEVKYRQGN